VIEAVTGAGKTRVGIAAAARELDRGGKVMVLVPTVELLRQWYEILLGHIPGTRVNRLGDGKRANFRTSEIVVATVQSARRRKDLSPPRGGGLLIADECHRYGSECNQEALDGRYERRLGLSATYGRNDNGNADWLDPYFGGVCYRLDYKQALRERVIADFSVALVGVSFSADERLEYEAYRGDCYRLKKKLVNEYGLPENPFGEFMKEVDRLQRDGSIRESMAAGKYLKAFKECRRLLAETPGKLDGLLKLRRAIERADRTLVFTMTIEGALSAADTLRRAGVSAMPIHSEMGKEERRELFDSFQNGGLQAVVAPLVLDEGVDVPEADLAVVLASTKTKRQMIQRMGRVLRKKEDGRLARFAFLFVEGTSEDPDSGAHEDYIKEITGVAAREARFEAGAAAEEVSDFLCDMYPRPTPIIKPRRKC
jgi:superfamily II DNA or RNA helicase